MFVLLILGLFVGGLIFGSYVNSWVWRVHTRQWKFGGRSMCVHCRRALRWYENVPVVSFIALRGKCRTCRAQIPWEYPLVEAITGGLFAFVGWYHLNATIPLSHVHIFRDIFFVAILVVVFVYDAKYQIIPTGVVWAGGIVGVVLNIFFMRPFTSYILLFNRNAEAIILNLALAALVGWAFFAVQYYGSRGRWVGGGDVRLGAMLGFWVGWPNIGLVLFLSYIFGALYAIPLLVRRKKSMESKIAFGTFLAMGALVTIFYGSNIIQWYAGLLNLN